MNQYHFIRLICKNFEIVIKIIYIVIFIFVYFLFLIKMRSKRMRRRLILRFASTISSKASTEIIEQPVVKKIKIEYTRVCGL